MNFNTKKLVFLFTLQLFSLINAQNLTYHKRYDFSNPYLSVFNNVASVVSANSQFITYSSISESITVVQKNDLNGTPVLIKTFPFASNYLELQETGGYLYLTGTNYLTSGLNPVVAKIDTSNLNIIYYNHINLSSNSTWISKSIFLTNGNLLMVGSMGNNKGLFVILNTLTGSIINSYSLSVGSTAIGMLSSAVQISNTSIIFSGYNPNKFIGKAYINANNISINEIYFTKNGNSKLYKTTNNKKLISVSPQNVFKFDTTLSLLSSTSNGFELDNDYASYGISTNFINDKLYMMNKNAQLDIIDTSLNYQAAINYQMLDSVYLNPITIDWSAGSISYNNNYLYLTCSTTNTQSVSFLYSTRTNIAGNIFCGINQSTPLTSVVSNTSSLASYSLGSIVLNNTVGPMSGSITTLPNYFDFCLNNSTNLVSNNVSLQIFMENDYLRIKSNENIGSVEIYDLISQKVFFTSNKLSEYELVIKPHITEGSVCFILVTTKTGTKIFKKIIY